MSPTISRGPPHNADGEAGSCTRCGKIHSHRADFKPRGVCKKHVGLHSDIEGLCEDWRLERAFDLWCQKNDLWPTDENYKIWKEKSPSVRILQMICKHGNNVCIQCHEEHL